MRLHLSAVGNPDYNQPTAQSFAPAATIPVNSLNEASREAQAYIRAHNLGGGNFPSAPVFVGRKCVACISYNGRVWVPVPLLRNGKTSWIAGRTEIKLTA